MNIPPMEENYNNQKELVLNHLVKYGSLTQKQAMELYGVGRLSARIAELRKLGFVIETGMMRGKNRFGRSFTCAEYTMRK